MKTIILAIASIAFVASSAAADDAAAPEWVKALSFVEQPALEIDNTATGVNGMAYIKLRNNGSTPSKKVGIECALYDAAGNTVDLMTAWIGPIQPGKLGIAEAKQFNMSQNAREMSCEIVPARLLSW